MEKLLQCFEYIKRYHIDMLDSISIMLELFIIKNSYNDVLENLIDLGNKRKQISLDSVLSEIFGKDFTRINPSLNALKILKTIKNTDTTLSSIEEFLHIITQKKTANKLFYYSTPLEVNELLVRLLDIQSNESVYNPCYGIGSLFLMISQIVRCKNKKATIALFGEELDSHLAKVARLTCKLAQIDFSNLIINDILKAQFFNQKFDKIICNPPFSAHIGVQYLKNDKRFSNHPYNVVGGLIKTYPEWAFLIHSLFYLKKRGVFILRTLALQKLSLESELMKRLHKERLIEAIIELPKNIFPYQSGDFCILVLSPNNKHILNIDAKSESFWKKDGKYNRLINLDSLLESFFKRKNNDFCFLLPYTQATHYSLPISPKDLLAKKSLSRGKSLQALDVNIFRGQRVYGGKSDTKVQYFDVGLADFSEYGFSENLLSKRHFGDKAKIKKYALKPFDICLSLRGNTPKVTIFSQNIAQKLAVANAGIVIVRCKNKSEAIGLYCYFYSQAGQKDLSTLYESHSKTIDIQSLKNLRIPPDFQKQSEQKFQAICDLANKLELTRQALEKLR
ncbi:N-6 DNA methylase [Helicobacter sp. 23-1048]